MKLLSGAILFMKAIVCMNEINGIGHFNGIPWHSRLDFSYFKKKTIGNGNNAIVMGRKTFESLKCRPLTNRRNYVLTKNTALSIMYGDGVVIESNPKNILLLDSIFDEVYIIGGAEIYRLFEPYISEIFVTRINNSLLCDTFFPIDLSKYHLEESEEAWEKNQMLIFSTFKKNTESV